MADGKDTRNGQARAGGLPAERVNSLRAEIRDREALSSLALLMNSAGNETRMRILYLLWRSGEVRVNDIAAILDLTTPAISQQLKKLRAQRLVQTRRDAQTIFYRLNRDVDLVRYITQLFEARRTSEAA